MENSTFIISAENIVELMKKAKQLLDSGEAKAFAHATFSKNNGATAVAIK